MISVFEKCVFENVGEITRFEVPQKALKFICYALTPKEIVSFENERKFYKNGNIKSIKFCASYHESWALYKFDEQRNLLKFCAKGKKDEVKIERIEYFEKDGEKYAKGKISAEDAVKKYKIKNILQKCDDKEKAFYHIYNFDVCDENFTYPKNDYFDEECYTITADFEYGGASTFVIQYDKYGLFQRFYHDYDCPSGVQVDLDNKYRFYSLRVEYPKHGTSTTECEMSVEYAGRSNYAITENFGDKMKEGSIFFNYYDFDPWTMDCRFELTYEDIDYDNYDENIEKLRADDSYIEVEEEQFVKIEGNEKKGYFLNGYKIKGDIDEFKSDLMSEENRMYLDTECILQTHIKKIPKYFKDAIKDYELGGCGCFSDFLEPVVLF